MTENPTSSQTSPERLRDIDTTEFARLARAIFDDRVLPQVTITHENPNGRPESAVEGFSHTYPSGYIEGARLTEPAGPESLDPSRIVEMLKLLVDYGGIRAEIQTLDGVLATAAIVDHITTERTDRKTSRQSYEQAIEVIKLAVEDFSSE